MNHLLLYTYTLNAQRQAFITSNSLGFLNHTATFFRHNNKLIYKSVSRRRQLIKLKFDLKQIQCLKDYYYYKLYRHKGINNNFLSCSTNNNAVHVVKYQYQYTNIAFKLSKLRQNRLVKRVKENKFYYLVRFNNIIKEFENSINNKLKETNGTFNKRTINNKDSNNRYMNSNKCYIFGYFMFNQLKKFIRIKLLSLFMMIKKKNILIPKLKLLILKLKLKIMYKLLTFFLSIIIFYILLLNIEQKFLSILVKKALKSDMVADEISKSLMLVVNKKSIKELLVDGLVVLLKNKSFIDDTNKLTKTILYDYLESDDCLIEFRKLIIDVILENKNIRKELLDLVKDFASIKKIDTLEDKLESVFIEIFKKDGVKTHLKNSLYDEVMKALVNERILSLAIDSISNNI